MFGLLFTLCGSMLLAIKVAVRDRKETSEMTHVVLPISGKVSPKILSILQETYFFRTGLLYIGIGAVFQIFPEFDLSISSLDIFIRLGITIVGFFIILGLSNYVINKIAERMAKKFPPYDPNNQPPLGTISIFED